MVFPFGVIDLIGIFAHSLFHLGSNGLCLLSSPLYVRFLSDSYVSARIMGGLEGATHEYLSYNLDVMTTLSFPSRSLGSNESKRKFIKPRSYPTCMNKTTKGRKISEKETRYENYPFGIVCSSSVLSIASCVMGTVVFSLLNLWLGIAYLILCLVSLILGLRFRCTYCSYYGKVCFSGFGRIARSVFRKGDPDEFADPRNLRPVMISSFSVLVLPLIGGIVLMILEFTWIYLVLFVSYLIIAGFLSFTLKKNLFCKYCKQAERGCPAYEGMQGKSSKKES